MMPSTSKANGAAEASVAKPKKGANCTSSIYELLPRVMQDIGPIEKTEFHTSGRFRFRSIDTVISAIQPVFVRHGLSLSYKCRDHRTHAVRLTSGVNAGCLLTRATMLVEISLHAPDGTSVQIIAAGEGQDIGGDKATSKAMTSAIKHALLLGLLVPSSTADEASAKQDPTAPRNETAQDDSVKTRLRNLMARLGLSRDEAIGLLTEQGARRITELTNGQAMALAAALERRLETKDKTDGQ